MSDLPADSFNEYIETVRLAVRDRITALVGKRFARHRELYDLMLDYPLRPAKGLRPAMLVAACRMLGGTEAAALPSATALELYHNAFLVHDDVEDGAHERRSEPTLHEAHGVPVAVHVGDGMLALALEPLLENTEVVGVSRAFSILEVFSWMARTSAEGQMQELSWIRDGRWDLADRDYVRMVAMKTAAYTFMAPVVVGARAAGASRARIDRLSRFALLLGVAFQITDDIRDVEATPEDEFGKDPSGDLWEGKRTLLLLHCLRSAPPRERHRLLEALAGRRPTYSPQEYARRAALLARVEPLPGLSAGDREALRGLIVPPRTRTGADVALLRASIARHDAIGHARRVAGRYARRSREAFRLAMADCPRSPHRSFLEAVVDYTTERTK